MVVVDIKDSLHLILAEKNCIAIPGIGGFSVSYKPACITSSNIFCPPRREIKFKESIVFDNYTLRNFVAKTCDANDADAEKIIADFAEKIKKDLESGQKVTFESLGEISLNNKSIFFSENISSNISKDSFGLKQFDCIPLRNETPAPAISETINNQHIITNNPSINNLMEKTTNSTKTNTTVSSSPTDPKKKFSLPVKWIVIGAVCLLLTGITIIFLNDSVAKILHVAAFTEKVKSISLFSKTKDVAEPVAIEEEVAAVPASVPITSFCIITGSYTDFYLAAAASKRLVDKGYLNSEVIPSETNRYRVSAECFNDKNTALEQLESYRASIVKDAWILTL